MWLCVTGASGAGKSASLGALGRAFSSEPVSCVEFDSVGVPGARTFGIVVSRVRGW